MRNRVQSSLSLFVLTTLAPLVGCASFQDCEYETGQKLRAWHAYQEYKHSCGCPLSIDYSCGWKAGYYDVATGGNGCPPITAPPRYWKPSQILVHCDEDRKQWYVGFQDGAAYASKMPDTHYLKLWMPPCQPCGCKTNVCHPSACQTGEYIEDFDGGYPVESAPIGEFEPALAPPPTPDDLPPGDEGPSAAPVEESPAPSAVPVAPAADSGLRIIGPLDVDLTDARLTPFVQQSGRQIILIVVSDHPVPDHMVLAGDK